MLAAVQRAACQCQKMPSAFGQIVEIDLPGGGFPAQGGHQVVFLHFQVVPAQGLVVAPIGVLDDQGACGHVAGHFDGDFVHYEGYPIGRFDLQA